MEHSSNPALNCILPRGVFPVKLSTLGIGFIGKSLVLRRFWRPTYDDTRLDSRSSATSVLSSADNIHADNRSVQGKIHNCGSRIHAPYQTSKLLGQHLDPSEWAAGVKNA
jgi:hypothetical protein